ncbi:hypothetical protein [Thermosulfurimonas sp. F29]|uniref:hypothetical protein n=1 Tax=Thermosulfurimonas sp. F29 TaxID=2867247 RepID=UPI001C83C008|nr:hypothetical protein [Thermosulfurimonas sp. F29]MBX6422989.1 hypothetical protein [Thermosulfurimonas sp. F29]
MRRPSRSPLWNLVFVVILIMALIWARYSRTEKKRTLLVRFPILSPARESLGEVSFWVEDRGDRLLKVELSRKPGEDLYVILYYRGGVGREVGRISGTVLIRSLGPTFSPEKISAIVLKGVSSGRIYGEARPSSPKG